MPAQNNAIASADFDPSIGIGNPNTTQIPDLFLDKIMPHLTGCEVKVMLYIYRRTFGFKKDQDAIAYSQFLDGIIKQDGTRLDYGAGVSNGSLATALDHLVNLGLIFRHQLIGKQGKEATIYEVNRDGQPHYRVEHGQVAYSKNWRNPTPKIGETPTPKIGDTTNSINQHTVLQHTVLQHTEKLKQPEQPSPNGLVCVGSESINQDQLTEKVRTEVPEPSRNGISHVKEEKKKPQTEKDTHTQKLIAAGVATGKATKLATRLIANHRDDQHLDRLIEQSTSKDNPAGYLVTMIEANAELPAQPHQPTKSVTSQATPIDFDKYTTGKYAYLTQRDEPFCPPRPKQ